jgi:hypothetical protein
LAGIGRAPEIALHSRHLSTPSRFQPVTPESASVRA